MKEQKKANESSTFISNYTFDPEQSRKNLANMIIVHEYPLSMVKHLEFKIYSSGLQPFFKISSRNTINNDIMKIYEYEKANIMGYLGRIGSRIVLTTFLIVKLDEIHS